MLGTSFVAARLLSRAEDEDAAASTPGVNDCAAAFLLATTSPTHAIIAANAANVRTTDRLEAT
jgi:hypothetical protein